MKLCHGYMFFFVGQGDEPNFVVSDRSCLDTSELGMNTQKRISPEQTWQPCLLLWVNLRRLSIWVDIRLQCGERCVPHVSRSASTCFGARTILTQFANNHWMQVLGNNHPEVGKALNNLAVCLRDQQKFDEAEGLLREALNTARQVRPYWNANVD